MLRKLIYAVFAILVASSFTGCGDGSSSVNVTQNDATTSVTAVGKLMTQGATTYQYGTHVLKDDSGNTLYALKSSTVVLSNYVNTKVTVKGDPVPGYPADFGPAYLDVNSISPALMQ